MNLLLKATDIEFTLQDKDRVIIPQNANKHLGSVTKGVSLRDGKPNWHHYLLTKTKHIELPDASSDVGIARETGSLAKYLIYGFRTLAATTRRPRTLPAA